MKKLYVVGYKTEEYDEVEVYAKNKKEARKLAKEEISEPGFDITYVQEIEE